MGDLGVGKVFTIGLVFILICAICFFSIADGIVELIKEFFRNLAEKVLEALENLWDKIKQFFGYTTVKNGMIITAIEKSNVESLREQIEGTGVDTEQAGITEILLRKMLLAQAVTSSTQDTLCVAEIEQADILKGTGYSNLQSYLDTLDEENSKDVWPIEDYDYDLYYLSEQFFYFKDEDDMMGKGEDKYFIGVMGSIIMKRENGGNFVYVSEEEFETARQEYIDEVISLDELLKYYTVDASGQMQVYSIVSNTLQVDYEFEVGKDLMVDECYIDNNNSSSSIIRVPVNIETNVDSSTYVLSIELLMHMLDISASPEYLDYFIDYALEQTKITVRGYKIENEDVTYDRIMYNIPDGFIFELYDTVNGGDVGSDNMIAYKDIIFKRKYGEEEFDCSVVDLPDFVEDLDKFEDIDFGEDETDRFLKFLNEVLEDAGEDTITKEEFREDALNNEVFTIEEYVEFCLILYAEAFGDEYGYEYDENSIADISNYIRTGVEPTVEPLHTYLLSAYDPGSGYSLGTVEVVEATMTTKKDISLVFTMENISTWYGDIKFNKPKKTTEYYTDSVECEKDEYIDFSYGDLVYYNPKEDEEKKKIYIYNDRANEASIVTDGDEVIRTYTADIFDNVLVRDTSIDKEINYQRLTLRGLGLISFEDGGTYNERTGAGEGSDYLYARFNKTNVKDYVARAKYKREVLHISTNIPRVSLSRVNAFLGQWKNKDGEKTKDPQADDLLFDSEGTKVKYNDIYSGTSVVGDMFESGAYMVFELLESSESTKKLVNVFKYIMYVYTGTDYGVTEDSMLGFIFSTVPYGGADYNVNTEMSPSRYVLTKEQLTDAINKADLSYIGNSTQARQNLLSCVDDFIYIQDTYKVNAVFAIAVTMQESGCGTAWAAIDSSWHNWASMAYWTGTSGGCSPKSGLHQWCTYSSFNQAVRDFGNYIANYGDEYCGYYEQGRYSVLEITELYAGPSEQAWGPLVVAKMTDMYESIGIQGATGGALEGISEDGCETITFGDRTYVEYKQGKAEYANIPLAAYEDQFPYTNLKSSGCAITSDAIIATGFGVNATPISVNNMGSNNHDWILAQLTGRSWGYVEPFSKSGVIQQLKQGYPVMVKVVPGHPTFSTSSTHYFTILSISEDGNSVYVSDPGSHSITRNGWLPTSILNSNSFELYRRVY